MSVRVLDIRRRRRRRSDLRRPRRLTTGAVFHADTAGLTLLRDQLEWLTRALRPASRDRTLQAGPDAGRPDPVMHTGHFRVLRRFGAVGDGPGQFRSASAVTITADGTMYIADREQHRVQMFRADGTFVGAFGSKGAGPGQFNAPVGLFQLKLKPADGQQARALIFVADSLNHRVQQFTQDGTFQGAFGEAVLQLPVSVCVNGLLQVFVADKGTRCIHVFSNVTQIRKFGEGRLRSPTSITHSGHVGGFMARVFVADALRDTILVFSAMDGTFLHEIGTPGWFVGRLHRPSCVYHFRETNTLHVTDGTDRMRWLSLKGDQFDGLVEYFGPEHLDYAAAAPPDDSMLAGATAVTVGVIPRPPMRVFVVLGARNTQQVWVLTLE
jgi:hypothetical protein